MDFLGARVRTIAKGNKNSVMSKYMRYEVEQIFSFYTF